MCSPNPFMYQSSPVFDPPAGAVDPVRLEALRLAADLVARLALNSQHVAGLAASLEAFLRDGKVTV